VWTEGRQYGFEPVYSLAYAIVIPWLTIWFRWHIEGLQNIPKRGAAILASNHISYLDPLALAYASVKAGRRPRFLAKSEPFQDRRIAWVLRGCGQIEVKRGSRDAPAALAAALEALGRGELVLIFPEGTVTTNPELEMMAPKSGVSRLALASRAPVIPCGIWGTANVWPKGHANNWRPRQEIVMNIGEPMVFEGDPARPGDWMQAGATLMDCIGALVAPLRPLIADRRGR
jgi:1-acyl-sn-glycerol-3-phosphate acyltransferase